MVCSFLRTRYSVIARFPQRGALVAGVNASLCLSQPQLRFHSLDDVFQAAVAFGEEQVLLAAYQPFADLVFGRDDGGVALAAEVLADFGEGRAGVFAGEPHGEHPRMADDRRLAFGLQRLFVDTEHFANRVGDVGQADCLAVDSYQIGEGPLGKRQIDAAVKCFAGGVQAIEGTGELTSVAIELRGKPFEHCARRGCFVRAGQLFENGQSRGQVRGINSANQATADAGDEFAAEVFQFGQSAIGSEDNLSAGTEERVDGVLQFSERRRFASEKLQIVDQEEFDIAILLAKTGQTSAAEGFDELRGKLFGRQINSTALRGGLSRGAPGTFEQMRFAAARRARNEQRRVAAKLAEQIVDRSVRETVPLSHNKSVE